MRGYRPGRDDTLFGRMMQELRQDWATGQVAQGGEQMSMRLVQGGPPQEPGHYEWKDTSGGLVALIYVDPADPATRLGRPLLQLGPQALAKVGMATDAWLEAHPDHAPQAPPDTIQTQALRLIITYCPALAAQAANVLADHQEGGQRQRDLQVNRLVALSLRTGAGYKMEPEHRMLLAKALVAPTDLEEATP